MSKKVVRNGTRELNLQMSAHKKREMKNLKGTLIHSVIDYFAILTMVIMQ